MIKEAISGFSVNNLQKAIAFYTDILGFKITPAKQESVAHVHTPGGAVIFMYEKPNHKPAEFTILNLIVDNIDLSVDDLKAKGIAFEHYDNEYLKTDEKGITRNGTPLIAWFKDPFGNFISVLQDA
jgi:catechol 2,3-dioxygenase-like lactoylglutathione lyase family enzyme